MIRGWSVKNVKNPPGEARNLPSDPRRGIISDNAKKLGDVIDRVRRDDERSFDRYANIKPKDQS